MDLDRESGPIGFVCYLVWDCAIKYGIADRFAKYRTDVMGPCVAI